MFYRCINRSTDRGQSPLRDEAVLVKKMAQGDWKAFTELFHFYLPRLSRFIYPFANHSVQDTEEIIQEVFLKIWEKRETLQAVHRFDHYLFRMAKNKLIDMIRHQQAHEKKHFHYSLLKEASHSEPEQALLYAEYHDAAKTAVSLLSPKLQSVFLMSTENELSLDEIACRLNLPKATVKKRLYLACVSVKNYLRAHVAWSTPLLVLYFLF
jgi:RNA polymerase sigma-70 factor (ECF subfamily)